MARSFLKQNNDAAKYKRPLRRAVKLVNGSLITLLCAQALFLAV